MTTPPLTVLHDSEELSPAKLATLRQVPTSTLIASLQPGCPCSLKARPGGMILDGHHRVHVLRERGVDVDALPREVIPREVVPLEVAPREVRILEAAAPEVLPLEVTSGPALPDDEE